MLKGKNIFIELSFLSSNYVGLKACATSHKLSIQNQLSAVTHKETTDSVVTNEMTGKAWNMTTDNLMQVSDSNVANLETALKAGTDVYVALYSGNTTICTGHAVVTSVQKNFPNKENSTYTATIQGNGLLSLTASYAIKAIDFGITGLTLSKAVADALDTDHDLSKCNVFLGTNTHYVKYTTYQKFKSAVAGTTTSVTGDEYNEIKASCSSTTFDSIKSKLNKTSSQTTTPLTPEDGITGKPDAPAPAGAA